MTAAKSDARRWAGGGILLISVDSTSNKKEEASGAVIL